MCFQKLSLSILLAAALSVAQTLVDLGNQARNADFTKFTFTRPVQSGTTIPPTCTVSDMFFHTAGAAGRNVYICTATNVWTIVGGNTASKIESEAGTDDVRMMTPLRTAQAIAAQCALPGQTGFSGTILTTDGSMASWSRRLTVTPGLATAISVATQSILADRYYVQVTPASTLTLTSTPTIPAGADGQFLVLTNTSTANTLTVQDEASLAGSGLHLGGGSAAIGPRQSLHLVFNATLNGWVRVGAAGGGGGGGAAWERQFIAARCQNTVAGAGFSLPSSNAPTAVCRAGTNTTSWATLDWDDTGTKTVFDTLVLPSPLPSTVKVDIAVSTATSATAAVNFRVATACSTTGNPDPAFNTAQTIGVIPSTTANNIVSATLDPLTIAGCSAGGQLRFKIDRDTTDASTATASLHWVKFYGN